MASISSTALSHLPIQPAQLLPDPQTPSSSTSSCPISEKVNTLAVSTLTTIVNEDQLRLLQEIFKEQQKLIACEEVLVFYKTLEETLSNKFQTSILRINGWLQKKSITRGLLTSSLIMSAELAILGAYAVIGSMFYVGLGFHKNRFSPYILGFTSSLGTHYMKKLQVSCSDAISVAMCDPKHSQFISELIARRVSLYYFSELKRNTVQYNKEWAIKIADIIDSFITSSKLEENEYKTEEEIIKALIEVIQEKRKSHESEDEHILLEESSQMSCEIENKPPEMCDAKDLPSTSTHYVQLQPEIFQESPLASLFVQPETSKNLVESNMFFSDQENETIQSLSDLEIDNSLGINIPKQIESAIEQREQGQDRELREVNNKIQKLEMLQKKPTESREELTVLMNQETASLNAEIKNIHEILDNLNIWKKQLATDSAVLNEKQKKYEEKLKGIENKAGKFKEGKLSKKQQATIGNLVQQIENQEVQQNLIQDQCKLYEQEKEHLQNQFQLLTNQQKTLQDKLEPLHEKYCQKSDALKEQQLLTSPEEVHAFYKTLEKMLGSKFQASVLLTSGLLQRKDVRKDHLADAAEYGVEAVFGFIAGMISVGTLGVSTLIVGAAAAAAGAAAGKAAGSCITARIDKKYEGRAEAIGAAMNNPKHAWTVAELVARRVTQKYLSELKQNTVQQNQEWAKKAADILYLFIASKKLKGKDCKTEDEMIQVLIDEIQERIEKEKNSKGLANKKRCVIL